MQDFKQPATSNQGLERWLLTKGLGGLNLDAQRSM